MEKNKKVELLAPAGSPQAFFGAVSAGADAVYLGGAKFSARAYAENFTEDELVSCIRYGRLFGVKSYLTVNTLFKEQELKELPQYLSPLCEAGLTGVIVQDLGALALIRDTFPDLELHASTQMTICNSCGAEFLKSLGVSRIVPARELSLEELIKVKRTTGLELETFVHGAMCYCYSGQCLFSSILGGRSGNRGRCAQPCRLPYKVKNHGNGAQCYPLSLKDMCTIDHIPALVEAGIDSFKIEGRMKKPEYAAGVTAVYRKNIDCYYELRERLGVQEASEAFQVSKEDREILSALYVRSQLHDGYYFKHNGREMITLTSPAYSGASEELLERLDREYLQDRPRLSVDVEAVFLTGEPAKVFFRRGETVGEAVGSDVQPAMKQPITEENLRKQLSKLGESPFAASEMRIQVDADAFYPLKQVNDLRREAVQALERELLGEKIQKENVNENCNEKEKTDINNRCFINCLSGCWPVQDDGRQTVNISEAGWAISVRTIDQLMALSEFTSISLRRIYIDGDLLLYKNQECKALLETFRNRETKPMLFAALPYVLRDRDMSYMEKMWTYAEQGSVDGFLIRSLDELGFLRDRENKSSIRTHFRTDAGVYVWNTVTARQLSELVDGFCLPYELKSSEARRLVAETAAESGGQTWEKIIYGRIPMMITANCVHKTLERCNRNDTDLMWMEDRFRTNFPVLKNCDHCLNIIYNSVPLALFGERSRLKGIDALRLDFTIETGRELIKVLETCLDGGNLGQGTYTTGHEKRGVE